MKKGLLFLALLMALLLALPALAEGANGAEANLGFPVLGGQTDYPQALCFAGETLYALGSRGLYRCAPGADAFETALDLTEASAYRWQTERPDDVQEAALWSQAIDLIAADGDTLVAVQPWSGQVLYLRDGALEVAFDLPQELLTMEEDEDARRGVLGAACQGGELFLLMEAASWADYGKTELYAVDLATQAVRRCSVQGAASVAPGAQGQLLLFKQGGYVAQMLGETPDVKLVAYDIASDSVQALMLFDENATVGGVAYDAPLGAAVLVKDSRIVRADAPDTALAYMPASFLSPTSRAACSPAGRYAMTEGNYVFLRDISTGIPVQKTELRISGTVDPARLAEFSIQNPDIAVIPGYSEGNLRTALLSGDPTLDVLCLSVPDSAFAGYVAGGYLAQIDSQALDAWVATLYPAIGEAVTREGKLFGVPVSLAPDSWTIDETMWQAAGMGEEPQTYADVLDAVALWLDEKAEEYPDFTLSDIQQLDLCFVAEMIVREYVLEYETPGELLSFDTDVFRKAMGLLAGRADLLSSEHEQWGMPILYSYNQGFGVSYNDSERMRMILPPSLDGGERRMTASVHLLAISAASQHQQEAARFVAWWAENLSERELYPMVPSLNDPVESPYYPTRVAQLTEQIASLQERIAQEDSEEKLEELEAELAWAQGVLERSEDMRYSISPESIAVYREMARQLTIPWNSVLAQSGVWESLEDVIMPACADGLEQGEIDALIAQLDRVMTMAAQESAL